MKDETQFTLRLPAAHVEVLREIAAANDRSVSAEVRRLIRARVEQELLPGGRTDGTHGD